jgi:hypothetical protein
MYKKLFLFTIVLTVLAVGTARAELLAHFRFDSDANDTVYGYQMKLRGGAYIDTTGSNGGPAVGAGALHVRNNPAGSSNPSPKIPPGTQTVTDYAILWNPQATELWNKCQNTFTLTCWARGDDDVTLANNYNVRSMFALHASDYKYGDVNMPCYSGAYCEGGYPYKMSGDYWMVQFHPPSSTNRVWWNGYPGIAYKSSWDHWAYVKGQPTNYST